MRGLTTQATQDPRDTGRRHEPAFPPPELDFASDTQNWPFSLPPDDPKDFYIFSRLVKR